LTAEKLEKIKFGTDGWRGIIGFDFNLSNLSRVVVAACQELHYQYYKEVNSKKIIIGYDRRFMASEFAKQIVPFVKDVVSNRSYLIALLQHPLVVSMLKKSDVLER